MANQIYYLPDASGTDPDNSITNDTFVIFSPNQRIEFKTTVFFTGLQVVQIGTTNLPLIYGTDWTYGPEDIDIYETAKMKTADGTFSAILLKSIQILKSYAGVQYTISCNYQQLYPVISQSAVYDDTRIQFTPELLVNMLNDIASLKLLTRPVSSVAAVTDATAAFLEVDLTGTSPANLITGEIQTVDVLNGKNFIFPANGSFYKNSVIITEANSSVPLTFGTDYQIFGMDVAKTKTTNSVSEVDNFIVMTKSYIGNINLTYQAYGGTVTVADVQALAESVQSVTSYLNNFQFVTAQTLAENAVVKNIVYRLGSMEDRLRILLNNGTPTYADASGVGGVGTAMKIRSTDTNLHWWTIAQLYKVNGSNEVTIADRMHFRMQFATLHLSADVYVNVDLNLPNPFVLDSVSVNQDVQFTPFGAAGPNMVVAPQFRILYNNEIGSSSGVLLQVGLPLPTLAETIGLQDVSGSESCWLLLQSPSTAISPQDNTITLPDGTPWDSANPSSLSYTKMLPNKTGYLAWFSSINIVDLVTGSPLTTTVPVGFRIQDVRTVQLNFTAPGGNYPIEVPVALNTDGSLTGVILLPSAIPGGSPTSLEVKIVAGELVINAEINVSNNNLVLTQVIYHV